MILLTKSSFIFGNEIKESSAQKSSFKKGNESQFLKIKEKTKELNPPIQ